MITLEALDVKVNEAFDTDNITLAEWEKKKNFLNEIWEPEYADGDRVIWVKYSNGWFHTTDDDLAYFCWRQGCSISVTQDYVDGSETFTVSLPETEEEYEKNIAEAKTWWEEVYE